MARPEETPWFPVLKDLELEVNLAPQNSAVELERVPRRLIEFPWWLIGFWRYPGEDLKQNLPNFCADTPEMLAHFVDEFGCVACIAPPRLFPRELDRLIWRVKTKKAVPENRIALLMRILRETSLPVPPLSIGDPAILEVLPMEGTPPPIRYHMSPPVSRPKAADRE